MERHQKEQNKEIKCTVGFVVPTHLRNQEQYNLLLKNIALIRKHHPTSFIKVISDASPIAPPAFNDDKMIELVQSRYPGSAEMSAYEFYLRNPFCTHMVMLHDSMSLTKPLNVDTLRKEDISFLWHFTNHVDHWSSILEPETPFNIEHNIRTHDDLICFMVNHEWKTCPNFVKWFNTMYWQKRKWAGCFGVMSWISHDFLVKMDQVVGIHALTTLITDKRRRCAAETLFALSASYVKQECIVSSLDGLYYDGVYHNRFQSHHFQKATFNR